MSGSTHREVVMGHSSYHDQHPPRPQPNGQKRNAGSD